VPRASIDIGSNSLLLLVQGDDGATLADEARIVGLGKGLGDRGMFRPDRMDAALAVLADFARLAREHGVEPPAIRAVATSAARRALNAATFFERVKGETGIAVRVVGGEEEARLTWLGARLGLDLPTGPLAVVDLGGGSTEVVVGEGDIIAMRTSLEVGTVRLTEQHLVHAEGPTTGWSVVDRYDPRDLARLREHVARVFTTVRWPVLPRAVVGVAGTATTLAAMDLGLEEWDAARVHGHRLTRGALRRQVDRLLDSSPEQRRQWAAVAPERADYLLAGACVLVAALESARRESLRVSVGGVRHGAIQQA
jgi:exopolyphosphatase/guanosine-5'-triphosphate,3'-diphosphate pyrophosphatase